MDKRIGAQLFTLRNFCKTKEDLEQSFIKIKKIGYKVIQVSGIGDIPAKDVKKLADKYDLTIACTHRGFDEYKNHIDDVIKYHKELGCNIAGLGSLPYFTEIPTKEQMLSDLEEMNKASEILAKEGIRFAYHNHAFEFQKYDGKYMMDYFLENGKFDLIVDVYWLAYAGVNPAKFIEKLGKRAIVIHFKDLCIIKNSSEMAEVMEGNLDWDSIIAASEKAGSLYAMVEQDKCMRDPFESMEISYNNLKAKGFN